MFNEDSNSATPRESHPFAVRDPFAGPEPPPPVQDSSGETSAGSGERSDNAGYHHDFPDEFEEGFGGGGYFRDYEDGYMDYSLHPNGSQGGGSAPAALDEGKSYSFPTSDDRGANVPGAGETSAGSTERSDVAGYHHDFPDEFDEGGSGYFHEYEDGYLHYSLHPDGPSAPAATYKEARRDGKMPKKIQWLDERRKSTSAAHVLDPAGQNPGAFNALVDALETHRRETKKANISTPLTNKVSYYTQRSPGATLGRSHGDESDASLAESSEGEADAESAEPSPDIDEHPRHSFPPTSLLPPPTPGEDAGMPSNGMSKYTSRKRAKSLVQNHSHMMDTAKAAKARRASTGASKLPPRLPRQTDDDLETNRPDPVLERSDGILSSLLQLYGNAADSDLDTFSTRSGYTSGAETPWSAWSSDVELDRGPEGAQTPHRFDDRRRKRSRIPRPRATIPALGLVPRHAGSRTGGGVFGALIATTGNLIGPAAPYHARFQPDIGRSGYALSRYSIGEPPTPPPPIHPHDSLHEREGIELQRIGSRTQRPMTPYSAPPSPTSTAYQTDGEAPPKPVRPGMLQRMPSLKSFKSFGSSRPGSPMSFMSAASSLTHFGNASTTSLQKEKKQKKRKRKKNAIFITRHIAQIIQREEFLLKLTRAMMMFGSPSHRLQSQIQSAARVLDVHIAFLHLPDVVLISFDDASTGTSHVKLIRQGSSLDISRLIDSFDLYWKVIHDKLSVTDASSRLDSLMLKPPTYNWWQIIIIGGMCSSAICTVAYGGSFIDALVSFPLGGLMMVIQQLSVRNILYVHVFEITVSTLFSFLSAALAASHKFCYSAVASSSVVLILPGFIVLTGSLEIMSRNIVSGSVRLCFAMVYALFLGFGFAMGAQIFEMITSTKVVAPEDYECSVSHHADGPWYQRTPSKYWAFLTVPMFSTFLSLKNQAPWNRKETLVLIVIACIGWVTNYFSGKKFVGQSDIIAAIGAFAVGIVANVYARIFSGNAFVVMVTGILFQLPSGLGSGGLLSYATEQAAGSAESYISGFRTTLKLISVAIGLAIGLGLALVITHPIQSRKREAGIFSL